MTINITEKDGKATIVLSDRLDSITAPELEEKPDKILKSANELYFDFNELEYISSAGLIFLYRICQTFQKTIL